MEKPKIRCRYWIPAQHYLQWHC